MWELFHTSWDIHISNIYIQNETSLGPLRGSLDGDERRPASGASTVLSLFLIWATLHMHMLGARGCVVASAFNSTARKRHLETIQRHAN